LNGNYILSGDISYALSAAQTDALLKLRDGNCALLFLYALRRGGVFSPEQAALELMRTTAEIEKAAGVLRERGLFAQEQTGKGALLPADELPEYTAEEIVSADGVKSDFPAVVEEAQRILGKTMTGSDMKILFGIYDHLKLPAEVIVLLLNHCVEFTRERSGPGRLPSMKTVEKEAYSWFNREIITYEMAEDYLRAKKRLADIEAEVKRILQINGRGFSPTERQYVEDWLKLGFDTEAIEIAYDRTVVKTGGLQWKYMNSILLSWDKKGLRTAREILSGDKRQTAAAPARTAAGGDDSDLLKKILERSGGI
jgi:DnaD/phage-associated family protein